MKTIEKIAHCNFMNQHFKNKDYYNIKVIDEIIHNESSHVVAEFKDYLIKGDNSEFLMQFYKKKESFNLLPYIYKNIKKKQRVIDIQQEQEDREENIKNGLYEQEKEPTIFTTQAFDSILNQTDTSGVKQFFDFSYDKSGESSSGMVKIMNNIENAEKKAVGNNSKKNKINLCKLKKGNNEFQYQYKKNITLNEPGYNKKFQSAFNNKKGEGAIFNENKNIEKNIGYNLNYNNNEKKDLNKNNLKQLLRQVTDNNNNNNININNNNNNNNNHKKCNNFSTQITYIDSCNNHIKNAFDLKGIETIKKIGKTARNPKETKNSNEKEKEKEKQINNKNNSQTYSSKKEVDNDKIIFINNYVKEKDKNNLFTNNNNKENSDNFSINQSDIKIKMKEKINIKQPKLKKQNMSRNNNNPIYQFDTNIKTYCEDPLKFSSKNKNTITSYKTKSQTKNKTKGYQTSRNKYDNKNMYINISKSNLSKNHQSIDSEINNNRVKKNVNINQMQNKHNNLKNNLINALLGSQNNKKQKKMTKYKGINQKEKEKSKEKSKEKDNNKSSNVSIISIIDSNDLKEIQNTSRNNNLEININKNNEPEFKENNININNKIYNPSQEKSDSQNKRVINNSNFDKESNNKISSTSCTKTMSINSYGSKLIK